MPSTPHAIQTLRFELRADAVPQARRLPERLSALCRQELAVVLEEEFAAHCPPHQQLRLPQLVLELPAVAARRLEAELPDLLRRALRTALGQLSVGTKATVSATPEATAGLEVLEYFLRNGRLPWQVAAGSFSLDEVLHSVAKHQAAAFRALLLRLGQTAQRRQRLVWQLNADQLQLLLVVLEPAHAPFLHAYVLATLAAHRREPLAPVTSTALRSIIYELVLTDLLLHAGTAFNRRAFLERQVRQLAAQYNLSFSELLRQLVAAELALTPRTQSALSVLLQDLHQRYRPADTPATAEALVIAGQLPDRTHPDTGGRSAAQVARDSQPPTASAPFTSPQIGESLAANAAAAARAAGGLAGTNYTAATTFAAGAATATDESAAAAAVAEESVMATTTGGFLANPAAAFTYYLQHGSLPLSAPAHTAQLLAGFPAWLKLGWRELRPALQAGGPAALHRLARLLTEPMLMQLLRLALPGQVRPVQAVLESVWQQPATRAIGISRPELWAHTFGFLLRNNSRTFSSPAFQQWLMQQLAVPRVGGDSAMDDRSIARDSLAIGSTPTNETVINDIPAAGDALSLLQAQEVVQYHLSRGLMPPWWASSPARSAPLRALLAQVLRERPLPDFLRTQPLSAAACQRLAALADFSQLTRLLAARRVSNISDAGVAALAELERRESAGSGASEPSGWLQLLRTAYLTFYLQGGRTATTGSVLSEIQQLAVAHHLSVPATLGKIRRLLASRPSLLGNAFFASLNQILPSPLTSPAAQQAGQIAQAASQTGGPEASNPFANQASAQHFLATRSSQPEEARQNGISAVQEGSSTSQSPLTGTQSSFHQQQSRQPTPQASLLTQHSSPLAEQLLPSAQQTSISTLPPGFPELQSGLSSQPGSLPSEQHPIPREQPRLSEEQRAAAASLPVTARLTQLPMGIAARDLVFYHLRHQHLPWWAPANLTGTQLRQLFTQVTHEYRAGLQALVQAHGREPAFRQALAELASFAQLARFVSRPGQAAPGRLAPAVLAALDQQLGRAGEPVARLLRQAYLTAAFHPNPADIRSLAAEVRAQAARTSTAWRTVLRYVAWLHRQLPALATTPFFAALLAAAATYETVADRMHSVGHGTRTRPYNTKPAQGEQAANALQVLEEYLRTGQASALSAASTANSASLGFPPNNGATVGAMTNEKAANSRATASKAAHSAGSSPASGAVPKLLAAQWKLLLRPEHRAAWQPLRPLLASRTVRTRLLEGLTEGEFWQLLRQLYPDHYRLAFRIAADWQLLARQNLVKLTAPALFEVLLALIQSTPAASWRPETAVRALLAAEEALWPQATAKRGHSRAGQLLAAISRRGLVLRGPLAALLTLHHQAGQVPEPAPPSAPIPFIKEDDRPLETVYLANAGLVLLWPFLTMLFDRLGYLENQQFRDEASRQRAALLLQFLASGTSEVPEYQLPLNKLLCGMPQGQPLPRELALTPAETELGESLLKAVIARWDALKNTSIAGLRETFLLRPGKLEWLPDDRIVLTVEPKTLDILLDRRPWSISIIKLPWMAAPLYITWR